MMMIITIKSISYLLPSQECFSTSSFGTFECGTFFLLCRRLPKKKYERRKKILLWWNDKKTFLCSYPRGWKLSSHLNSLDSWSLNISFSNLFNVHSCQKFNKLNSPCHRHWIFFLSPKAFFLCRWRCKENYAGGSWRNINLSPLNLWASWRNFLLMISFGKILFVCQSIRKKFSNKTWIYFKVQTIFRFLSLEL